MTYAIRNWERFQHYKSSERLKDGKKPPWIKLYVQLLNDANFFRLSEASRYHYMALLLVASFSDNRIDGDPGYLQAMLRTKNPPDLSPLVDTGFLIEMYAEGEQDKPVADLTHYEARIQESADQIKAEFAEFWKAYPKKSGRIAALKAWSHAKEKPSLEAVLTSLAWQKESDQWKRGFIPNPATWLNEGRYLNEPDQALANPISAFLERGQANGQPKHGPQPILDRLDAPHRATVGEGVPGRPAGNDSDGTVLEERH